LIEVRCEKEKKREEKIQPKKSEKYHLKIYQQQTETQYNKASMKKTMVTGC